MNLQKITLQDRVEMTESKKFEYEENRTFKIKVTEHYNTRRYEEFKKALRCYLNGDYGQVEKEVKERNEAAVGKGIGLIDSLYTCDDILCEIHSFIWKEDGKQIIQNFVFCYETWEQEVEDDEYDDCDD